jgi:hypothetical protein
VDLSATQASIRQCYNASQSGKGFASALEQSGLILARATKGDEETARIIAGLNSHLANAPEWKTRSAIKEGDLLIIDERGHAHRVSERTTGAERAEVAGKLVNLSGAALPSIEEGKAMQQRERERQAEERQSQRREKERQQQHFANQRAAKGYARSPRLDLSPRPMHPDDHAKAIQQREQKPKRAMLDAGREMTDRAQSEKAKTAKQEKIERLMRMAEESARQRELDGGGRTRGR